MKGYYINLEDRIDRKTYIENNIINKQPDLNTNVWKQDQCSKTLRGCLLRFKDYLSKDGNVSSNKTLPYGAFPATFQYDNKK